MNSKLIIIGLMLASLLVISASGQKLTTIQQVILQDDRSADHLQIDIPTGKYKFENCNEHISIGGTGTVTVSGCKVTLQDLSEGRRVLAEVDLCNKAGKADVAFEGNTLGGRIDPPQFEFVVSDSNIGDSTFDCEQKPIDPK